LFLEKLYKLYFEKYKWGLLLELERILASSCRRRILLTLSKVKRTHVTNLVRIVNSTYNEVNRNLQILEKENIIKITYYGRKRMIELNKESPKTKVLLKVLNLLHQPLLKEQKS